MFYWGSALGKLLELTNYKRVFMEMEQLFEEVLKEGSYAHKALGMHHTDILSDDEVKYRANQPWEVDKEDFYALERLCKKFLELNKTGRFKGNTPADFDNLRGAIIGMFRFLEEIDN